MAGPWNASLGAALKFTDFTPTIATIPTTTNATAIWAGEAAWLEGELLGVGVTISTTGKDKTAVALAEAMLASAAVQEAAEKQARGSVSQDTAELRKRARAMIDRWLRQPRILELLGASVSRKRVQSMATEYPNTDLDTTDYAAPLLEEAGYGVDEDQ